MSTVYLNGTPAQILDAVAGMAPGVRLAMDAARFHVPQCKREVRDYEAATLYALAHAYNRPGAHILEIGTALGYSCAVLAEAAPEASITTLNPKDGEYQRAVQHLAPYDNVQVVQARSWDYLGTYRGPALDMIFVDGDHGKVACDFAWWRWLAPGGLFLLHDYAPVGSKRPCQPVYEAANALREALGRGFDVLVQADDGVGVCGFYRQDGEHLPSMELVALLWDFVPGEGWVKE